MTDLPDRFFETSRLWARPFDPADLDALAALTADPEINRFVGDGVLDRATTKAWIEISRANVARQRSGTGVVILRETGDLIGWVGVARPNGGRPELVYGLARAHWGTGLGRELVAGLVPWAAAALAETLHASVDPANRASVRLLEAAGFRKTSRDTMTDGAIIDWFERAPDAG